MDTTNDHALRKQMPIFRTLLTKSLKWSSTTAGSNNFAT